MLYQQTHTKHTHTQNTFKLSPMVIAEPFLNRKTMDSWTTTSSFTKTGALSAQHSPTAAVRNYRLPFSCTMAQPTAVTGQLADTPTRGLDISRIGQFAD